MSTGIKGCRVDDCCKPSVACAEVSCGRSVMMKSLYVTTLINHWIKDCRIYIFLTWYLFHGLIRLQRSALKADQMKKSDNRVIQPSGSQSGFLIITETYTAHTHMHYIQLPGIETVPPLSPIIMLNIWLTQLVWRNQWQITNKFTISIFTERQNKHNREYSPALSLETTISDCDWSFIISWNENSHHCTTVRLIVLVTVERDWPKWRLVMSVQNYTHLL